MNKILEQIKKDNLKARKEKNKELSRVLTTLVGEIESVGKNNGNRETNEEEAIKVIEKFKKNASQTYNLMLEKQEGKVAEGYSKEIDIYESYLPKKMTKEELEKVVKDIIENGKTQMGQIMGELSKAYKGKYDGKMASEIVKKVLKG